MSKTRSRITAALLAVTCLGAIGAKAAERQPVSKVLEGYSYSEYMQNVQAFNLKVALVGGDVSLFGNTRMGLFFHTAMIPPRVESKPLPSKPNPAIGKVVAETPYGKMSLDDFLKSPKSFMQGIVVIHRGKVVYERYPGMKPTDSHLWASTAKPLAALIVEQLIDEGKIDQTKGFGFYVPDFRGSAWENIKILDIMNMASGLNIVENDVTRSEPNSMATRLFRSEFGETDPITGKVESTRTVLKAATKETEPGTRFDYSSLNAQALVILVEEVAQKRLSDLLDERVFGQVPLDGPIQFHLSSADYLEAGHGLVSSRLRTLAMFGMLYTPSWRKISSKQVVSAAALHRIRKETPSHEFYMAGYDGPRYMAALNDYVISNNRQWDDVFPDGDFFKLGFMGQGLYVSPDRDLVIAYYSTNPDTTPGQRYMRPIAKAFGK